MKSTILLIEDTASDEAKTKPLLEDEGFEVIEATNGLLGGRLAQERLPDLIVCAINLVSFEGFSLLATLKCSPLTTLIPFIFVGGTTSPIEEHFATELGADGYLPKPLKKYDLLEMVCNLLALKRKRTNNLAPATYSVESLEQAEKRLDYLLHFNLHTKLPNRLLLREQFDKYSLSQKSLVEFDTTTYLGYPPEQFQLMPILLVSFDRLDRLEDVYIPQLILKLSERLLKQVKGIASLTQLQFDQLAIILVPPERYARNIVDMAQQVLELISQPIALNINGSSQRFRLTASIGMAFYPCDAFDFHTLLQKAQMALKVAQTQGGNQYQIYTPELKKGRQALQQVELEIQLAEALQRNEFELYFQPQFDLQTSQLCGAEALLYWHHPEQGLLSAAQFIQTAEDSGLIVPLGESLLKTACAQFKAWQAQIPDFGKLRLAVKFMSPHQLQQPYLSQRVAQILAQTGFDSHFLELEFSENSLMADVGITTKVLSELKMLGVRLAIDNFGQGYSSLSHLCQFPFDFDVIKLDQSLIVPLSGRDITSRLENVAILLATFQLAHQLKLEIIAQGVTSDVELAFLKYHHCHKVQSDLFQPPLSSHEFSLLVGTALLSDLSLAKRLESQE